MSHIMRLIIPVYIKIFIFILYLHDRFATNISLASDAFVFTELTGCVARPSEFTVLIVKFRNVNILLSF